MLEIEIREEPIDLFKLLKLAGVSSTGGEAKALISSGEVLIDGVVETKKRKKVFCGTTITIGDTSIRAIKAVGPSS